MPLHPQLLTLKSNAMKNTMLCGCASNTMGDISYSVWFLYKMPLARGW